MKCQRKSMLYAIALLAWGGVMTAQQGSQTVHTLAANSSVIVVGSITPQDAINSNSAALAIKVDRVIKGSITSGSVLIVEISTSSSKGCSSLPLIHNSAYAIWFLDQNKDGNYQFVPSLRKQRCTPFETPFETPRGPLPADYNYPDDTPSEDKLAYELAVAIADHQGDGPQAFIENPFLLSGASAPALLRIYKKQETSSSPHVRIGGVLGLVEMGDPGALRYVRNNLQQIKSTPLRDHWIEHGQLVSMTYGPSGNAHPTYDDLLVSAIDRISKPTSDAIAELGGILNLPSADVHIQRATAHALQNVHNAQAVQLLAPLLSSPDQELRSYAIGGISCFANGVPQITLDGGYSGPDLNNPSPFKTLDTIQHFAMDSNTIAPREDYYLSFWRQWWSENVASISAQ